MIKILVTGATGFIGKHLVPQLRKAEYEVIEVNSAAGDVAEEGTWQNYPLADIVIHLAGKSFVPESWTDPAAFIKCNVLGTVGALNYCRKNNARLIWLSSYLYGNPETLPIPETAERLANNPYALSKKLAEEACEFFAKSFNVRATIFRPFNVYGAGQDPNFLIPSIIAQQQKGVDIRVKDLEPKRDYLYVADLIDAIVKAVESDHALGVFNAGSGTSYSVAELIQVIQDLKGTTLPVVSDGQRRQDEVMDTVADVNKAKNIFGWQPRYTLSMGLKEIMGMS